MNINTLGSQLKIISKYNQTYKVSMLNYGNHYSVSSVDVLPGVIARGAVIAKTKYSWIIEFLNGIKGYTAEPVEIGKCYNFVICGYKEE